MPALSYVLSVPSLLNFTPKKRQKLFRKTSKIAEKTSKSCPKKVKNSRKTSKIVNYNRIESERNIKTIVLTDIFFEMFLIISAVASTINAFIVTK